MPGPGDYDAGVGVRARSRRLDALLVDLDTSMDWLELWDKRGVEAIDALLRGERPPRGQSNVKHHVEGGVDITALRLMLLREGLPEDVKRDEEDLSKGRSTLRGRVWKTFLQVDDVRAQAYMDLVAKGPCADADVIAADVTRTFQGDEAFHARVKPAALTRVLHAFVHRHSATAVPGSAARAPFSDIVGNEGDGGDGPQGRAQPGPAGDDLFRYRQGMNVLAAALLFVMPEVDAFFAFSALITRGVPRYVTSSLQGVHTGASLVDTALSWANAPLHASLAARGVTAPLYAFGPILTLGASWQPLQQVLRLWDLYLAYGVHWNLICCTARVCMAAKDLYTSPNPLQHIGPRTWAPLDANAVMFRACEVARRLPPSLIAKMRVHGVEEDVDSAAEALDEARRAVSRRANSAPRRRSATPRRRRVGEEASTRAGGAAVPGTSAGGEGAMSRVLRRAASARKARAGEEEEGQPRGGRAAQADHARASESGHVWRGAGRVPTPLKQRPSAAAADQGGARPSAAPASLTARLLAHSRGAPVPGATAGAGHRVGEELGAAAGVPARRSAAPSQAFLARLHALANRSEAEVIAGGRGGGGGGGAAEAPARRRGEEGDARPRPLVPDRANQHQAHTSGPAAGAAAPHPDASARQPGRRAPVKSEATQARAAELLRRTRLAAGVSARGGGPWSATSGYGGTDRLQRRPARGHADASNGSAGSGGVSRVARPVHATADPRAGPSVRAYPSRAVAEPQVRSAAAPGAAGGAPALRPRSAQRPRPGPSRPPPGLSRTMGQRSAREVPQRTGSAQRTRPRSGRQ